MTNRVDPNLLAEIKQYGDVNIDACFNCGTCTAICPLSSTETPFPRNSIRMLQLGLRDRLRQSTDPWLCYYCGECSQTCPRQAEPAEAQMAIRRWLTAQYDRSGHGARFYTSSKLLWRAVIVRASIPLVLLALFHIVTGFRWIVTDHVELNRFAPVMWVWVAVLIHFAFLGSRVVSNALTMSRWVLKSAGSRASIPLLSYFTELKTFFLHFFVQKRWRECGPDQQRRWLVHLFFASGYVIMLVLIVGLLGWFQTDELYPLYHPQRWLGYYATLALVWGSLYMLVGRMRRCSEAHRFSDLSDWLFPGFILVGALTGILVHAFRYAGWPWPTYVLYVVHVMAMVAMLDVEVGIGKWTHMIHRPLAIYLQTLKERALSRHPSGAAAPQVS
jgi:ferredoxin